MSRLQRKLVRPPWLPRMSSSPPSGDPSILIRKFLFLIIATAISWIGAAPANAGAHPGQFQNHGTGRGGRGFHGVPSGRFSGGPSRPGHFHHHGGHGAIIIAAPLLGYYPPVYYTGPIVTDGAPMTFIEQGSGGSVSSYWYYCADPPGYYPQVQACPSGWQAVGATPPY
ncbi:MAG: hypothetical protein JWR21_3640 [Herminiimonas sp.]|nr:hypothetical protein [Herminiimonas sp.]MDB5855560.1 hypothetical protein [Herminiimonas sp.]